MTSRSIILAIETAIGGGSISVLLGDGTAIGELTDVSRAEDLLIGIDHLVDSSELSRDEIDMIAVSLGPGSFTGIRIGIATALGLKNSLNAKCVGVDAFEAISLSYPTESTIVVLPLGRWYFACQEFSCNRAAGTQIVNEEELIQTLGNRSDIKIVFHSEAGSARYQWNPPESFSICTERLSTLIGKCALAGAGEENMKPLYLRNQGRARNLVN